MYLYQEQNTNWLEQFTSFKNVIIKSKKDENFFGVIKIDEKPEEPSLPFPHRITIYKCSEIKFQDNGLDNIYYTDNDYVVINDDYEIAYPIYSDTRQFRIRPFRSDIEVIHIGYIIIDKRNASGGYVDNSFIESSVLYYLEKVNSLLDGKYYYVNIYDNKEIPEFKPYTIKCERKPVDTVFGFYSILVAKKFIEEYEV